MRNFTTVALGFLLLLSACDKDKKLSQCESVICTPNFVALTVQVRNGSNAPRMLDEVYTINSATGERIHFNQNLGAGFYILLDDTYRQKMVGATVDFDFVGKRNGETAINEHYSISADCCHVKKESGKDVIVLR